MIDANYVFIHLARDKPVVDHHNVEHGDHAWSNVVEVEKVVELRNYIVWCWVDVHFGSEPVASDLDVDEENYEKWSQHA